MVYILCLFIFVMGQTGTSGVAAFTTLFICHLHLLYTVLYRQKQSSGAAFCLYWKLSMTYKNKGNEQLNILLHPFISHLFFFNRGPPLPKHIPAATFLGLHGRERKSEGSSPHAIVIY